MDEKYKVAIPASATRRAWPAAPSCGGRQGHMHPAALATLYKVLDDWFPGAAGMSQAQCLERRAPDAARRPAGARREPQPGVWLNLGHGSSGWALACGSARVLADLIAGREPAIDITGLGQQRLRH